MPKIMIELSEEQYKGLKNIPYGSIASKIIYDKIKQGAVIVDKGEYISKEDISRVLLDRTSANERCLSKARELGNHKGEQYFQNLVFEDEQITSLIEGLSSASFSDSAENKGEWIDNGNGSYTCSNCKTEWTTSQIEKMCFCPTCGNPK